MAETIVAMDASLEVPMLDLWDLCKRTTSWVLEALQGDAIVVSYDETAQVVDAGQITSLEFRFVYGTNVHHALMLAREMLVPRQGEKRILFVAYAQPSAHCLPNGDVYFCYPPNPETTTATLSEMRECARLGIRGDFLLLEPDAPFAGLAAEMATMCWGSVGHVPGDVTSADDVQRFLSEIRLL